MESESNTVMDLPTDEVPVKLEKNSQVKEETVPSDVLQNCENHPSVKQESDKLTWLRTKRKRSKIFSDEWITDDTTKSKKVRKKQDADIVKTEISSGISENACITRNDISFVTSEILSDTTENECNTKVEISSDTSESSSINDNRVPIVVLERLRIKEHKKTTIEKQKKEISSRSHHQTNSIAKNSRNQSEPIQKEVPQSIENRNEKLLEIITHLQDEETSVAKNKEHCLIFENEILNKDFNSLENNTINCVDQHVENDDLDKSSTVVTEMKKISIENIVSPKVETVSSEMNIRQKEDEEPENYMIIIENEENMQFITNEDIINGKLTVSDDCDISITVGDRQVKIEQLVESLEECQDLPLNEKENDLELERILEGGSKYGGEFSNDYIMFGKNSIVPNSKQVSTETLPIQIQKSKTVSVEQVCKRIAMNTSSECENDEDPAHHSVMNTNNVKHLLNISNNSDVELTASDPTSNLDSTNTLHKIKTEMLKNAGIKLKKEDDQNAQGDRIYYFGKCMNCNKIQQRINGSTSIKCSFCDAHVYSVCLLCRKVFRHSSGFYNHLMSDHKEEYKHAKNHITDKVITCKNCGRYFMQNRYLREHLKTCTVDPEAESETVNVTENNIENVPESNTKVEINNEPDSIAEIETEIVSQPEIENTPEVEIDNLSRMDTDNFNELQTNNFDDLQTDNFDEFQNTDDTELKSEFETVEHDISRYEAENHDESMVYSEPEEENVQDERLYFYGKCSNCNDERVDMNDVVNQQSMHRKKCHDCGSDIYNVCSICEKVFEHFKDIYYHLMNDHREEYEKIVKNNSKSTLLCDNCGRMFTSNDRLNKHKNVCCANNDNEIENEIETEEQDGEQVRDNIVATNMEVLDSSTEVNEHDMNLEVELEQGGKSYCFGKCLDCDNEFGFVNGIIPKTCNKCNSFIYSVCSLCRKMFRRSSSIYNHLRNEHSEEYEDAAKNISKSVTSCKTCGRNFMTHRNLKEHEKLCDVEYYLNCKYCTYKTKIRQYLRNHLTRKHSILIEKVNIGDIIDRAVLESKAIFLKTQGKTLPEEVSRNNIDFQKKDNFRIEKKLKMYCAKCDLAFEKKNKESTRFCYHCSSNLQYQCYRCAKRYNHRSSITNHLKSECFAEDQMKYRCEKCDYVTFNKAYFRRHNFRRHLTPDCLMLCRWCERGFKFVSELNHHERRCKNQRMKTIFQCDACNFKSDRKGTLLMHVKEKHASLPQELLALERKVDEEESSQESSATNSGTSKSQKTKDSLMNSIRAYCTNCKISNVDAPKRHIRCKSCQKRFIYVCKHCLTTRSTYVQCRVHVLRVHKEKAYSCINNGCNLKFAYFWDLAQHMKVRCKSTEFLHCPKCDFKTKFKYALNVHMSGKNCRRKDDVVKEKIHEKKNIEEVPREKSNNRVSNVPDMRTFKVVKKIMDDSEDDASRVFNKVSTVPDMRPFTVINKKAEPSNPRTPNKVKKVTNEPNNETFKIVVKTAMQSDNRTFNSLPTFKTTNNVNNLAQPIYKCGKCDKTFKKSIFLDRHRKICGKVVKPKMSTLVYCDHCTFKTEVKHSMIEHIHTKHAARLFRGINAFKCENCPQVFRNYFIFERHNSKCRKS